MQRPHERPAQDGFVQVLLFVVRPKKKINLKAVGLTVHSERRVGKQVQALSLSQWSNSSLAKSLPNAATHEHLTHLGLLVCLCFSIYSKFDSLKHNTVSSCANAQKGQQS